MNTDYQRDFWLSLFSKKSVQGASNFPLVVGLVTLAEGTGWWFEEKRGRASSNCLQFLFGQAVNTTSRLASLLKLAIFISLSPLAAQNHTPKCPDTKPLEGVVSACTGQWTGKLFISRASLFSDSCFDWKIGHSFLAALSCQLSWHSTQCSHYPSPSLLAQSAFIKADQSPHLIIVIVPR